MADGKQKPIWYVVGCIGLGLVTVPCVVGIAAALGIPAFIGFTRRSATAEARANLGGLSAGLRAACDDSGQLPAALAPTITPSAERQVVTLDPGWAALGFSLPDPSYYAYSIERPDATTALLVAEGDLDGDGVRSRFVITCTSTAGSCSCGQVVVTDELE